MIDKFDEESLKLKEALKKTLTKESTQEQIDLYKDLDKTVDSLISSHGEMKKKFDGMKEDYINLVKNSSTTKGEEKSPNEEHTSIINNAEALEADMKKYFEARKNQNKGEK